METMATRITRRDNLFGNENRNIVMGHREYVRVYIM